MTTFLRDFLHKDRDQAEELDIVIINKYVVVLINKNELNNLFFQIKKNSRNRNGSIIKTILYQSTILCW